MFFCKPGVTIEVQADHGGMKITSCEILPAIVCYSSPEAKYGSLAIRNGNGRIWWKRFYMEPHSTRCTVHVRMETVEKRVP